jgi:hypothetical protein
VGTWWAPRFVFTCGRAPGRDTSEQLATRVDEIDGRLRKIHTSSLRKEEGGALLFMLGTLFTLAAVVIS